MLQSCFGLLWTVLHNRPIRLVHITILEHFVQTCQCLAGLGKYHQSAHRTVKAVGYTDEYIPGLIVFLLQVMFYQF